MFDVLIVSERDGSFMQVQSFQTVDANQQLAEKIIVARAVGDPYVKSLCSGDFLIDPIAHLIKEMIERGARCSSDDETRVFIIGQIPGFMEKATSPKYLRKFAAVYFKDDPNRVEMMRVFEKALSDEKFQSTLVSVRSSDDAEHALRTALAIFKQLNRDEC